MNNPMSTSDLLKQAWCKGYDQGHSDGLGCGHPQAARCRHIAESELDDSDVEELIAALQAQGARVPELQRAKQIRFALFKAWTSQPLPRLLMGRAETMADTDELIDALDHIIRVCRASRQQSRRIRWIAERARCAIEGTDEWDEIDLPRSVETDSKKVRQLKRERDSLQAQLDTMKAQCERLRSGYNDLLNDCINFDGGKLSDCIMADASKLLMETPEQSLAEIEARAIERAVDECAWYGDRVWMKIDEVREYAARLRQKGETP